MGKVLLLYVNLSIAFKHVKSTSILYTACRTNVYSTKYIEKSITPGYCYPTIAENETINNIHCTFKLMKGSNSNYLIECLLMSIEQYAGALCSFSKAYHKEHLGDLVMSCQHTSLNLIKYF